MRRLDGRVALVTGGGRGIGRAEALLLGEQGAAVVVSDLGAAADGQGHDQQPARDVVEQIRVAGGSAIARYGDVSDFAVASTLVEDAVSEFGTLDIVVNNAGILR